jgi:hypothetical protein
MKYIKEYESVNTKKLNVGDYVICDESGTGSTDDVIDFLKTNIGQYIRYRNSKDDNNVSCKYTYLIQYKNIPLEIEKGEFDHGGINTRLMKKEEIKYWSKNKKDLEQLILVNKYNL